MTLGVRASNRSRTFALGTFLWLFFRNSLMNHSWKCPSENWPAPVLFLGVIVRMTRHKSLLRSKIRQLLKENSQFKKSNFELENHLPSIADPIKMRHHLNITIPMGSWSTCSTTRCIRLALTVQDFGLESRGSSWSIMMS